MNLDEEIAKFSEEVTNLREMAGASSDNTIVSSDIQEELDSEKEKLSDTLRATKHISSGIENEIYGRQTVDNICIDKDAAPLLIDTKERAEDIFSIEWESELDCVHDRLESAVKSASLQLESAEKFVESLEQFTNLHYKVLWNMKNTTQIGNNSSTQSGGTNSSLDNDCNLTPPSARTREVIDSTNSPQVAGNSSATNAESASELDEFSITGSSIKSEDVVASSPFSDK